MMPTALIGDRFPALAPLPTIRAVRKGGTPAAAPIAIAGGATSAVAEMAPGPSVATVHARKKTSGGTSAARPRHIWTARLVTLSIVPLVCAAPKSSDTPSRVRNSEDGNVWISASAFQPAPYRATGQASATASTPTFRRENRLATMTASSATSDKTAGVGDMASPRILGQC